MFANFRNLIVDDLSYDSAYGSLYLNSVDLSNKADINTRVAEIAIQ
jgi:hypothetical protein